MNKIIAALIAGLFAVSVNAFAADNAAKPATPATPADASKEKPAAPAAKHGKKHANKDKKMGPHETTSSQDFGRVAPAPKHAAKKAAPKAEAATPATPAKK